MMIIGTNINKNFTNLAVLQNINIKIDKAEIVAIVGKSGAGKTTLLKILGTLLNKDSGKVVINNIDLDSLTSKKLAKFRNEQIGFVFQANNLLAEFSALENIYIPALIKGESKKQAEKKAIELLNFMGLSDRAKHRPLELSGGEQQRVAVARALINSPAIIFADEPSGNLDIQNKEELHKLFFSLREEFKQTFVIVTHDDSLAKMSDRTITMADGKIIFP